MGLKCSLLGHAYGEPEVERDREERGNEVVVTVQELRRCSRCDAETVVSENTEVRSVEPMPDLDPKPTADRDADAAGDWTDDEPRPAGPPTEGAFGVEEEDADPTTEDAVILDDEPASDRPERAPGEWPSADDTRFDEAERRTNGDASAAGTDGDETPAGGGADTAPDTTAGVAAHDAADMAPPASGSAGESADADDGVEILDSTPAEATKMDGSPTSGAAGDRPATNEGGGGESPEAADGTAADSGADAAQSAGADHSPGDTTAASTDDADDGPLRPGEATGIVSAGPVESARDEVNVDAVLVCPACGFSRTGYRSSHRAGDICPDCRRGYLAEE